MPRRLPPASFLPPELAEAIAAMSLDELKAATRALVRVALLSARG
jgi:hypothetical protein